jgi:putative transposase
VGGREYQRRSSSPAPRVWRYSVSRNAIDRSQWPQAGATQGATTLLEIEKGFQKAESLHFITFSCYHRLALLDSAGARETMEAVLEQTRARHRARIYAYMLMSEHVHLLVNEPPGILLAQFLKAVKQITSRKLRGARKKFWQDRYYDSSVRGEKARSEVIRYIHRNPVKRGLVEKPEDWPWSSFRHYATGVKGTVEIESQWTAFGRGNQLPEGVGIKRVERSRCPTQPEKDAAWMGHRG